MDTKTDLLLSINDDIAAMRDVDGLLKTIFNKMNGLFRFKAAGISLLTESKAYLEITVGSPSIPAGKDDMRLWQEVVLASDEPFGVSIQNPRIIKHDKSAFNFWNGSDMPASISNFLEEREANYFIHIPLQFGGNLIGFLILGFKTQKDINNIDLDFLKRISNLIAIAINNIISIKEAEKREQEKTFQLRLVNTLVTLKDKEKILESLLNELNLIVPSNYLAIDISNKFNQSIREFFVLDRSGKWKEYSEREKYFPFITLKADLIANAGKFYSIYYNGDFENLCRQSEHLKAIKKKYNISSLLFMNYSDQSNNEINILFGKRSAKFLEREIRFIRATLPQALLIINNFFAFEEINSLRMKLEQENNLLLSEISSKNTFPEIIGSSPAIQGVLHKIRQVAPLDATVLILGETGTGKELIAKAIHDYSNRRDNPFIKINCAVLPAQLIESELFGHEKGSFTGAYEKKLGKFELANKGTILLDEIGELPLDLQSKLLRVLQEKEFERIGGKGTIAVDVRIIASTNRNLENEVSDKKFRADLYFRLNVFPIIAPPLRTRVEDIPLLINYFIENYTKKLGKIVNSVSKKDLEALMQYDWPGNVRELEHLIERAMIISDGNMLCLDQSWTKKKDQKPKEQINFKPLYEMEKEYIIAALKAAKGKITGQNSASELLGINGKTLGSKMRKFGIRRSSKIFLEE
jgi:transcriptional regulator with GAF, ATPase, and Fis domain